MEVEEGNTSDVCAMLEQWEESNEDSEEECIENSIDLQDEQGPLKQIASGKYRHWLVTVWDRELIEMGWGALEWIAMHYKMVVYIEGQLEQAYNPKEGEDGLHLQLYIYSDQTAAGYWHKERSELYGAVNWWTVGVS